MGPSDIFRQNVLRIIKENGIMQKHVAEKIGEPPPKFNDYLRGRINFGEAKRVKLAKFLNVPYAELYIEHDQNRPKPDSLDSIRQNAWKLKPDSKFEGYGPLEIELLIGIIKGIEDYLSETDLVLDPDKKARLISLLYERFARTGEDLNQKTVVSYLKLVA